jgi:CBS domain-containing protein
MANVVRELMSHDPVSLRSDAPIIDAARVMQAADVGNVMVNDGEGICGIVTDRDVVVRAIAEGRDPANTPLSEICSLELATVSPDTPIETAFDLMRQKAIRRLPVVENGKPVGIVSIGDLVADFEPRSALADISSAPPNK